MKMTLKQTGCWPVFLFQWWVNLRHNLVVSRMPMIVVWIGGKRLGLHASTAHSVFLLYIYHLDIVTSVNFIVSPLFPETRILTDSRSTDSRKPQTTNSFSHRWLVVERQSHWHPHQDHGRCYTLAIIHIISKKSNNNRWCNYIEHFVDTDDEILGISLNIRRCNNGKHKPSQLNGK